ncbi:MAG: DUF459 domain-containing protein, partial [Rhizobiales bacterium]|nr:DUF459 domain-containing protein [Hyphomicrobiales bacterium]
PNEVVAQQPVAPRPEVVVVAPAQVHSPGERFGGDDGVFRFVVAGDALARGLGAGLERLTELDPRFEVVSRANDASGVARPEIYNWPAAIPKILRSGKFDAVVAFMGVNDYRTIKTPEASFEPGTAEWQERYKENMDNILASARSNGARVYWITLPPMQNSEFDAQMQMITGLQRERVVTGNQILVDVRPALLTPEGTYMIGDLDEKGKARRLRGKDGINFSRQGNDYLADLVMGAIRKTERVPELQSSKEDPLAAEVQVAVALPSSTSPLFGQQGIDGASVSFEAEALAKEVPQKITPDLSNAGKLGLRISRNSLAQRFYRTGEALGVPFGRFDDFSVSATAP